MAERFLVLRENGREKRLEVIEHFDQFAYQGHYRISQVFPVLPGSTRDPTLDTQSAVGFFFCDRAFVCIGTLLSELPPEDHAGLWYSHGLASIILFAPDATALTRTRDLLRPHLRAYEWWRVKAHDVEVLELFLAEAAKVEFPSYQIKDFHHLPLDIRKTLTECVHALYAAIARSAQYLPQALVTFQRLAESVNQLIDEITYLIEPGESVPATLAEHGMTAIRDRPVERLKRVHQRIDQLVQINAALAYLVSQGFSGIVPIFESECPIRKSSLLGIGTAYAALAAFSGKVEDVFAKYPIDTIVRDRYGTTVGINAFTSLAEVNPAEWDVKECQIDTHLRVATPAGKRPKLVYYSGRQGYRETKFAVTAPLQMLYIATTARWSPMTLSHELMHAHVTALLAAAFTVDSLPTDSLEREHFDEYERAQRRDDGHAKNLSAGLRHIVLNYCRFTDSIDRELRNIERARAESGGNKGTPEYVDLSIRFPFQPASLWSLLQRYYGDINEIMVHVFDYHYFYDRDASTYLGLLWESWSPVAVVLHKVEKYLFRSIVAIASAEQGTASERFRLAHSTVREALSALRTKRPTNHLVERAVSALDDIDLTNALRLRFLSAIYLADMTVKFLLSTRVHAEIMRDELRDLEDDQPVYRLQVGDFPGDGVTSPLALCADVLRRSLNGDERLEEEQASAWMLLACASALKSEEH